jgi:hypothetical protein
MQTATTAKPRVTPIDPTRFNIAHAGQTGQIWQDERSKQWHAIRFGSDTHESVHTHYAYTSEGAGRALVQRMVEIAECEATQVAASSAEAAGARAKIEKLGGAEALEAFDRALVLVKRNEVEFTVMVRGMLAAVAGKNLPAPISMQAGAHTKHEVCVVPGFSVKVDNQQYFIGGAAEYDSYNLHYFGTITKITKNSVFICERGSKTHRLRMDTFAWRNHRSVEARAKQNAEWTD